MSKRMTVAVLLSLLLLSTAPGSLGWTLRTRGQELSPISKGAPASCYGGVELTGEALRTLRSLDHARPIPEYRGPVHEDAVPERENIRKQTPEEMSALAPVGDPNRAESAAGAADLPQTPPASLSWQASGNLAASSGFPSDAQIAVSNTHVLVTARAVLAAYTKSGIILPGYPITARSFFSPLGLDNGGEFAINAYFDLRAIFDGYRKRFWFGALAYNSAHSNDTKRRNKFTIAVSKTENPLDGWYLYYWDATAHDGVANDPVYKPGDSADYPILGIDPFGIHETNGVSNPFTNHSYWHVIFYPADKLANGIAAGGWQYWDLTDPDGSPTSIIQPVVHHGITGRAYYASRNGNKGIVVWALTDPLTPQQQLNRVQVTVATFGNPVSAPQKGSSKLIKMTNLGNEVIKAVFRFPFLYLVTNDERDWFGDGKPLSSIRLIRMSVIGFPNIPTTTNTGFIDRTFGMNSSVDDQPNDHVYYAWPAIEVNKTYDMVIVYSRSATTLYPEVRFSAYYDEDPDIRPSRLLKAGETSFNIPYDLPCTSGGTTQCLPWGDTAGASVDPADDTAIWIAQMYARDPKNGATNNGNFDVWVGKVVASK